MIYYSNTQRLENEELERKAQAMAKAEMDKHGISAEKSPALSAQILENFRHQVVGSDQ